MFFLSNYTNRAIALFSLHITPLFTKVIATIATLCGGTAVAFVIYVVYTQLIVTDITISDLILLCSVVPVKPADGKRRRLTNKEKEQFTLSQKLKEIVVGLILGDLCIEKQKGSVNTRLRFEQSVIHKDYLQYLYELFKIYCLSEPKTCNKTTGKFSEKEYFSVIFVTSSLPCFNEFYELFYGVKKLVPSNIGELLTPLGLAHWICDDGTWDKIARHVRLSRHSFTLAEVNILADALNKNFDLKCYVNKHTSGGFIIIIPPYSVPILQSLLKEIMPPMMLYKIGL